MAYRVPNRIQEVSTTAGTADFMLANVVQSGFLRVSDIPNIASGDLVPYLAIDPTVNPLAWESGDGSYNTATHVLARLNVEENSLGVPAKINFANPPLVFLDFHSGLVRAALAGGAIIPRVGRYYSMPGSRQASTGTSSAGVYVTPIVLGAAAMLQSLSVSVGGTTNSGTIQLGIYSDDHGWPAGLIVSTAQVAATPSAFNTPAMTPAFLAAGLYWLAIAMSQGMNVVNYTFPSAGGSYGSAGALSLLGSSTLAGAFNAMPPGLKSADSPSAPLPATLSGLADCTGVPNAAPVISLGF